MANILDFLRKKELTPEEKAARYDEAKQNLPLVEEQLRENTAGSPVRELRDLTVELKTLEAQIKELEGYKDQPGILNRLTPLKTQKRKLDRVIKQLDGQIRDLKKRRKDYMTAIQVYGRPDIQQAA